MRKPIETHSDPLIPSWDSSAASYWKLVPDRETPFIAVSEERLERNLRRAQNIADTHGLSLRPHIKTHKSSAIARRQIELGATGITASKPEEALVFIRAGIPSVTVAYPIISIRSSQSLITAANETECALRCIVDSVNGVEALDAAAAASDHLLPVFIKVDVGLERCGVRPDTNTFNKLLDAIAGAGHLQLVGLLSHAGHSYGATNIDEIQNIARSELETLSIARSRIERFGSHANEISVGATPTVLASEDFTGVTEIRPGNYVFLDLTAIRLGIAGWQDLALAVVATVISENERYSIVDAGSKTLSSDGAPHGGSATGYGLAWPFSGDGNRGLLSVARLSEEHGFIDHGGHPIGIGNRVIIFPNHSCPVVNLTQTLVFVSSDGSHELGAVDAHATSSI